MSRGLSAQATCDRACHRRPHVARERLKLWNGRNVKGDQHELLPWLRKLYRRPRGRRHASSVAASGGEAEYRPGGHRKHGRIMAMLHRVRLRAIARGSL